MSRRPKTIDEKKENGTYRPSRDDKGITLTPELPEPPE